MKFVYAMLFIALVTSLIMVNVSQTAKTHAKSSSVSGYLSKKPIILVSWPTEGSISSPYGPRKGGFHYGIDIAAEKGTEVKAVSNGWINWAGPARGFGNTVVIEHGFALNTTYGHLQKIYVHWGQKVSVGDTIGTVGSTGSSTGPHLHLQMTYNKKLINPMEVLSFQTRGLYINDFKSIVRLHGIEEVKDWPVIFEFY